VSSKLTRLDVPGPISGTSHPRDTTTDSLHRIRLCPATVLCPAASGHRSCQRQTCSFHHPLSQGRRRALYSKPAKRAWDTTLTLCRLHPDANPLIAHHTQRLQSPTPQCGRCATVALSGHGRSVWLRVQPQAQDKFLRVALKYRRLAALSSASASSSQMGIANPSLRRTVDI